LRERCRLQRCRKSDGECGENQFPHCLSFPLRLMVRCG
jgi:hypothetical protein